VTNELLDLDLESRYFAFNEPQSKWSQEDKEIYATFLDVNKVVFDKIMVSRNATAISHIASYALD